jgi:hypothetical protein
VHRHFHRERGDPLRQLGMTFRAFAAGCVAVVLSAQLAFAQSDNNAPRDGRVKVGPPRTEPTDSLDDVVMRTLREGKAGVVLMDIEFMYGINKCHAMEVAFGRVVSGAWRYLVVDGPTPKALFNTGRLMNALALEPGEYFLVGVVCKGGDRGGRKELEGPFAKFQVKAGEATNLGLLKLHYVTKDILFGTKGSMKKTVEGMSQERRAEFAKAYPTVFTKAVERRIEVVGDAESDMTKRGRSILTNLPCPAGQSICL